MEVTPPPPSGHELSSLLLLDISAKGVFFWYLLFWVGCLPFLVGFKILFFWYCLPKTVGLEGLSNLLLRELEEFVDFARILVMMCFLGENLACKPRFQLGAYETFACKVYWFQNSAVVYQKQKVPKNMPIKD